MKYKQTNKQTFKVRQPQRAARSKRPNTPSDGSKNNGFHTTNQEKYPSIQPTNHQEDLSVSKSNTIQSTNQARCPVSPPHLYHPRCPAHQPSMYLAILQPVPHQTKYQEDLSPTPNQTYPNIDLPGTRYPVSPPHQYHLTDGSTNRHEHIRPHT